jgi:hypothetical protein
MQRQAVGTMRSEASVSERRACGLIQMHRATCRYRRRRSEAYFPSPRCCLGYTRYMIFEASIGSVPDMRLHLSFLDLARYA